jgi:hypothetical protein
MSVPNFLKPLKNIDRFMSKSVKRLVERAVFRTAYKILSPMFVYVNGQDLDIWSNKSYCEKPVVLADDGNIRLFRKWCQQFY